jgi:hypothetical protein
LLKGKHRFGTFIYWSEKRNTVWLLVSLEKQKSKIKGTFFSSAKENSIHSIEKGRRQGGRILLRGISGHSHLSAKASRAQAKRFQNSTN